MIYAQIGNGKSLRFLGAEEVVKSWEDRVYKFMNGSSYGQSGGYLAIGEDRALEFLAHHHFVPVSDKLFYKE